MEKDGEIFEKNGVSFSILEERQGKNKMVLCLACQDKMRRDHAERHSRFH